MRRDFIIKAYITFVLTLYKSCTESNVETIDLFGNNLEIIDVIKSKEKNLLEINKMILDLILQANHKFIARKPINHIIYTVIKYIQSNYQNDITLESVSKEVFITPSFLSILFKKLIGENFTVYLNNIRITKACELLKNPYTKIYTIALSVGFKNEKYFSYVFKKVKGVTPSQYRKYKFYK